MMKLLLLVFTFLYFDGPSHDIQVAFFKIHSVDKSIHLELVFEKEDILQSLNTEGYKYSNKNLQNYVVEHFSMKMNKKDVNIDFEVVQIENKHVTIKGKVTKSANRITSMEIQNSCLLDIEDHSNIIELRINDQERDFLMNKARTQIKVEF